MNTTWGRRRAAVAATLLTAGLLAGCSGGDGGQGSGQQAATGPESPVEAGEAWLAAVEDSDCDAVADLTFFDGAPSPEEFAATCEEKTGPGVGAQIRGTTVTEKQIPADEQDDVEESIEYLRGLPGGESIDDAAVIVFDWPDVDDPNDTTLQAYRTDEGWLISSNTSPFGEE